MERTKLKNRIAEKYGTQQEFAKACGITDASVSRFVSGQRPWKGETILKAAKLLDIDVGEMDAYFFPQALAEMARS